MDPIVIVLLVLLVVGLVAGGFALYRRSQRSGTVLAASDGEKGRSR